VPYVAYLNPPTSRQHFEPDKGNSMNLPKGRQMIPFLNNATLEHRTKHYLLTCLSALFWSSAMTIKWKPLEAWTGKQH